MTAILRLQRETNRAVEAYSRIMEVVNGWTADEAMEMCVLAHGPQTDRTRSAVVAAFTYGGEVTKVLRESVMVDTLGVMGERFPAAGDSLQCFDLWAAPEMLGYIAIVQAAYCVDKKDREYVWSLLPGGVS